MKEPWICPMDTRDQPQTDDDSEPEYILACNMTSLIGVEAWLLGSGQKYRKFTLP
jgi:hypothetical protein